MLYEKKVKVILHGYLKKLYPGEISLSGRSVAEVINGLCRQTKAFDTNPDQERHTINVLDFETEEKLNGPIPPDTTELHLVPAMSGGKGGFFKVIIGVVLIGVTIASFGSAAAVFASTWGSMLFNFGVSLVLGGLMEMLSPAPKIDQNGNTASDPEASKYLGGTGNTVKIGTRIPLLYGEHIAYGHYISFDIDAVNVA